MGRSSLDLNLDEATQERLQAEARRQDQSEVDLASDVIRNYLDRQDYKRQAIEAAVAEADKGVFISGEAMHRWIESWDTDNELPPPEPDIFPETSNK
jgi:predicted transcriptional regulator